MQVLLAVALMASAFAGDDPICADIQRLSAATEDAQAYSSLYRSDFAPGLLRGCFRSDDYFCSQTMLPAEISHGTMAKRIAACLADAAIAPGDPWPGLGRTTVTGGGLVFELEESGSERAHVGRILQIRIRRATGS